MKGNKSMEMYINKDRALNALQKIYGNQSKYGEYSFKLMDSITNITFSTGCIHFNFANCTDHGVYHEIKNKADRYLKCDIEYLKSHKEEYKDLDLSNIMHNHFIVTVDNEMFGNNIEVSVDLCSIPPRVSVSGAEVHYTEEDGLDEPFFDTKDQHYSFNQQEVKILQEAMSLFNTRDHYRNMGRDAIRWFLEIAFRTEYFPDSLYVWGQA